MPRYTLRPATRSLARRSMYGRQRQFGRTSAIRSFGPSRYSLRRRY